MVVIEKNTAVVLINYMTDAWLPIALNSFLEHFQPAGDILLVDNNPVANSGLRAYEKNYAPVRVIRDDRPALESDAFCIDSRRNHGAALDFAVEWTREHGYEYLLHFEPDCFIYGPAWWHELKNAIDSGYSMAAIYAKPYGPLQPVPSLWKLADIPGSFRAQRRGDDQLHPFYLELYDTQFFAKLSEEERESLGGKNWYEMWLQFETCIWDTAQKNWFDLAAQHKCLHTGAKRLDGEMDTLDSPVQFFHAWWGSKRGPDFDAWPQLLPYAGMRCNP